MPGRVSTNDVRQRLTNIVRDVSGDVSSTLGEPQPAADTRYHDERTAIITE